MVFLVPLKIAAIIHYETDNRWAHFALVFFFVSIFIVDDVLFVAAFDVAVMCSLAFFG